MKQKMREVVINKCFGGFGLSHKAVMLYAKLSGFKLYPFVEIRERRSVEWSALTGKNKPYVNEKSKSNPFDIIMYSIKPLKRDGDYEDNSWFDDSDILRDNINLAKVVRKLKGKANGHCASLKIVKIPFDVEYEISEYDGIETIEEKHKSWS